MTRVDKVYLVTRADLSQAQRAVQACHALRAFTAAHPEVDRAWYEGSNTLALLEVQTESDLFSLLRRAEDRSVPVATFREPDRSNELTAIALGPTGYRLCRGLSLALRPDEGGVSEGVRPGPADPTGPVSDL